MEYTEIYRAFARSGGSIEPRLIPEIGVSQTLTGLKYWAYSQNVVHRKWGSPTVGVAATREVW
jgi:hypothetical protein